MKAKALGVFADGARAGRLSRSMLAADSYLFDYLPDCPHYRAVSLTMPVVADQYDAMGVIHPVFEMNLPEGALRRRLELIFAKLVPDFDSLALLEIVGRSQLGRLRFGPEAGLQEDLPAEDLGRLLAWHGAEGLFDSLVERYAKHSGVSGVQPKLLLRDAGAPAPRLTGRGATHILKSFDPAEYPELCANEYFCLRAALHAGLPTAHAQLSEDRRLLAVERFDLDEAGDYLGMEDFCVLSGMRSDGRYSTSCEILARRAARFLSPEHLAAGMAQLFATIALASAIGNGDAHLKNFAVLYVRPGEPVRMAPVYDMLSTTLYQPRDVFALDMEGRKDFPDRARLLRFARQSCGLPNGLARRMLTQVIEGVVKARAELLAYAAIRPDFQPAAEKLARILAEGAGRLA